MGAYKDRTGKTRVGAFLQSIGSIFKKKTTTTTTPTTATPPINGSGTTANKTALGTALAGLGVVLGNAALGWIGQQLPNANDSTLTAEQQAQIQADNEAQAKSTGNGLLLIIGGLILAIGSFFYFKSRK